MGGGGWCGGVGEGAEGEGNSCVCVSHHLPTVAACAAAAVYAVHACCVRVSCAAGLYDIHIELRHWPLLEQDPQAVVHKLSVGDVMSPDPVVIEMVRPRYSSTAHAAGAYHS